MAYLFVCVGIAILLVDYRPTINYMIRSPDPLDINSLIRTYLKNSLSAHGGVMKRLKMLTYYLYTPYSGTFLHSR